MRTIELFGAPHYPSMRGHCVLLRKQLFFRRRTERNPLEEYTLYSLLHKVCEVRITNNTEVKRVEKLMKSITSKEDEEETKRFLEEQSRGEPEKL